MTEQLHDLLARIADQAGPGSNDPTLWDRARRARRRERALRAASVAALTTAALVGAVVIGLSTRSTSPPADRHTPAPPGPGIPSTVRGLQGDGGLDLETDLAVGPASVAIANRSGAFVVTAADGVYHRLRLPGYDPSAFNDRETGLALSPDGSRLVYGWRAPKAPGSATRPKVGTRIVDLRTGALQKIPGAPGYAVDKNLVTANYGYGWSPNGRYLVFETRMAGNHWYSGINTATGRYFLFSTETRPAQCDPTCRPMTVFDPNLFARVLGPGQDMHEESMWFGGFTPLPAEADWNVGRIAADGRRILVQPYGVGAGLVLVTDLSPRSDGRPHKYETTLLTLDSADWPDGAKIHVLGWVGADHALAKVNRGTGPDTAEPEGALVLVDLSSVGDTTAGDTAINLDVVGHVDPSDAGSTYSFATDFATVDTPTQDFDQPSPRHQSDPAHPGVLPSEAHNGGLTMRPVAYTAAGLALLAVLALALARQHRKRSRPQND